MKYTSKGRVILMGDLNSRTSLAKDYISNDNNQHIHVPPNYTEDRDIIQRKSQDSVKHACSFGNKLIQMCKSTSLKIVNGRVFGDSEGKFTCHQWNGSSVVDYVLTDYTTMSRLKYFIVEELLPTLSDHCMITFALPLNMAQISQSVSPQPYSKPAPISFKWHENAQKQITDFLSQEYNKMRIQELEHTDIELIEEHVDKLTKILTDTALCCLKKKSRKTKHNSKAWFNVDCHKMKLELKSMAKLLCKNPKNLQLRQTFFMAKRNFKQFIKQAKTTFKQDLTMKLENASHTNQKEYWQILKKLRNSEQNSHEENPIHIEEWVSHFKELFTSQKHNNPLQEQRILDELKLLESIPIYNELSFRFTKKEILTAISKLKPGKAPGTDSISSELIKAASPFIIDLLIKMFNHVLASGHYPTSWLLGLITPIHKKGSVLETDNYRGITVTSSLGKVFCTAMNTRLEEYSTKHALIDNRQSSNKKGARTTDNIFIIQNLFEKYCLHSKQKLYSCFVDFRKAFDSIWHEGLFVKLLRKKYWWAFLQHH